MRRDEAFVFEQRHAVETERGARRRPRGARVLGDILHEEIDVRVFRR